MSTAPSTSTSASRPNFVSIFNVALEIYKRKTKKDLASHPLLPSLQCCDSPEAVLNVLREQIPAFGQSQNPEDGLTKWVTPTVNVLYSFSGVIAQGIGLAFPSANVIFAGIDVLFTAANTASAVPDKIIDAFNRIDIFFHRLEIYISITPTTAMMNTIVQIMVEVLTILTIATKEVKRGRLKRFLKKLAGNRDIEDCLDKLDRLTQEEAQLASAEQLRVTHIVDGKVTRVDDRVKGVEERVQDVRGDVQDASNRIGEKVQDVDDRVQGVDDKLDQANQNQLRDSLLKWLSPPDPSTNHNIAYKAHHDGSSEWFFDGSIFNRWKSTGSFLWVNGKPGSGKSVLCSSIIQDIIPLRNARRASLAYFYFDFKDADKQNLHNLLPSLLIQLSTWSAPCCDILSQLYSVHGRGTQQPSDRVMVECLKEMLTLDAQGPTYIVMDALDECPITSTIPSSREEVVELVEELVGLHLPNLHICVTSRPEHDIQLALDRLTERPVSLHDERGQQEDIVNYVADFIRSNQRMRRWREEDKNLVIQTLSEKASGMFRWVICQLEILQHCFPPSVRRILDELPESLDETYERILREIRKPNQGLAHRLLQCLVVAVRPLRVEELAEVLAFEFNAGGMPKLNTGWRWKDQEEAVMSACSSLVTIVYDGGSRVVQFSHFSVKEFLTAERLVEPIRDVSRYHIRLEAAHTILAQACLGVLLRLDDRVDRDSTKSFPLVRYAAQHWVAHARVENVSSLIKEGMECLFDEDKPHFAAWIKIHDPDDSSHASRVVASVAAIFNLQGYKPVPLYYAALLGFRDLAEHLVTGHPEHVNAKYGIYDTPLHAAINGGHVDVISLLIDHGPDIRNSIGMMPLNFAARRGRFKVGQYLLDRGADINGLDDNTHDTPLMHAAARGYVEFARMLLERGALIDAQNISGKTALHLGAQNGDTQVVRLLLEHGANVDICDKDDKTASQFSTQQEIVELFSK